MSKPIKLARVHFADVLGAHDPSEARAPEPDTRKRIFTSERYDLTLLDNTLSIQCRESGRVTLVPWCRATEGIPLQAAAEIKKLEVSK